MGPVEEAGKVATGFFAAMASQPLALALVVCNMLLLGLFYFAVNISSAKFNTIMTQQAEVQRMLYQCVPVLPPPRPTG